MKTLKTEPADRFVETIVSDAAELRDRSLDSLCEGLGVEAMLRVTESLDRFRRGADNLYHQVRALFFLSAIYRYHLPALLDERPTGVMPYEAYERLLQRHNREAIDNLLEVQRAEGPSQLIASALARGYHQLAFQRLADQVRRSVRTVRGNQWMFRVGHPADCPLRIDPRMFPAAAGGAWPVLHEQTAVRMDFSHSGWSDIFFLGMDYPEGARVLNASIDLGVAGRDGGARPPVQAFVRLIDRPVLRLVSVDLQAEAELTEVDDVFDFAKDYLGLLKAAVIAAGVVPPAMEGCHRPMAELLRQLTGRRGIGLEVISAVNDIPKGSRLAVSTNLLGCLIAALMRVTGQVEGFTAPLADGERRLITARAILGEWLGGSGGGWQDSGGVWPGIKLICGVAAAPGDAEYGVSRGRLLPQHEVLGLDRVGEEARRRLRESLVLVYGGMAQNVGPILEMVTEKYLLRGEVEWQARQKAVEILGEIVEALGRGDIRRVGRLTTENFTDALQSIIPWCTNAFTAAMIEQSRRRWGDDFWGFWMLGGMSGGGMGFLFDPRVRDEAEAWLASTLVATKRGLEKQLAFAMDPLVYRFEINDAGTSARLLEGDEAVLTRGYYALVAPRWMRSDMRSLSPQTRAEWGRLSGEIRRNAASGDWLLDRLLPQAESAATQADGLRRLLDENGFDSVSHEQLRSDLLEGRIGLAQNRLPPQTSVEDVDDEQVVDLRGDGSQWRELGERAIVDGRVAVVTLAAGAGSRWTGGAGVVKGLHPFCKFAGRHRTFLEVHLAKTRKVATKYHGRLPHVFTTGYLTHGPIAAHLAANNAYGLRGSVRLSPGSSVGLRLVPTPRDLRFLWEEMPRQVLDEQQEKVRLSGQAALLRWAEEAGPASDYTDNTPLQCLHPVGHWYEVPNLLLNGTLASLLEDQPQLEHLMLHNIDTLGAWVDPAILGRHVAGGATLSFEVVSRRIDDRGGGLANVDGKPRLIEGLAMPDERDEWKLRYYNSLTTWIRVDSLLAAFGLNRGQLRDETAVRNAVREMAARLPTYITIKDVKKRWGHAQEDVFPVCQFEKLWGDMSGLPEIACEYFAVAIKRGQQLKDVSQLDGWVRDGSAAYVESLCTWQAG